MDFSIRRIKNLFDKNNDEMARNLINFKKWTDCRRNTLAALKRFQEEFDKVHHYSSVGRAVGNGASVLGGLASIVGFGLSFSKDWKPIADELMKFGSGVGIAGGATSISATIAETGFNAKLLKEVKATLEEDQRLTNELLDWFQRSEELECHIKKYFGCSVLDISEIFTAIEGISVLYSEGGKTCRDIKLYLAKILAGVLTNLPNLNNPKLESILLNTSFKVRMLLMEFCNNSEVRKAVWSIYDSFKSNPVHFDLLKMSIRTFRKMINQKYALHEMISSCGCQSLMCCVSATTCGILHTINFAVSVVALISAIDDVKNGNSKYSAMIKKTSSYLLTEFNDLKSYPISFERHLDTA